MRLLAIQELPQSKRVKLVFDDDSVLKTQPYLLADFGLYSGMDLTDEDYQALLTAAGKASAKGYGKSRIKNILYEKGIPQEFWDEALAEFPEMDDAIDRFLLRRWQGKVPDEKEVKRTVDALIRRGHSWKDIQSGLRRYRVGLELEEITEDDIS